MGCGSSTAKPQVSLKRYFASADCLEIAVRKTTHSVRCNRGGGRDEVLLFRSCLTPKHHRHRLKNKIK